MRADVAMTLLGGSEQGPGLSTAMAPEGAPTPPSPTMRKPDASEPKLRKLTS